VLPPGSRKNGLDTCALADRTLSCSGARKPSTESVEAHAEARAAARVAVRLPIVAAAHDHSGRKQPLHPQQAALLSDDVAQLACDGLERLLGEREALPCRRASSEQMPEYVERDPSIGITKALPLRRCQAEVGDSPAEHTRENIL